MRRFNEELIRIAPPPADPVEAGSQQEWGEVERTLGVPLPEDYKWLINTYGSGEFCDLLGVLNPFSRARRMNLIRNIRPILDHYLRGKTEGYPERCPFEVYPEPAGLLPVASDSNGGDMFWLTQRHPDEWTLVLYDWRGGYQFEQHKMGLVEFLTKWISGELPECFFGIGIKSPIIRLNPVFCPLGRFRP